MTKTDFAELKEKLCRKIYVDIYVQREHDAAIISELIEIIKLQSEAMEFYADPFTYTENEYGEKKIDYYRTYEKGEDSLSETTTRLQKLRDGK